MSWKAKIIVTYKPGILDPEAKTIQNALKNLGYDAVEDVKAGRYFELHLKVGLSKDEAREMVEQMSTRILSNPVIQQFSYQMEEVAA